MATGTRAKVGIIAAGFALTMYAAVRYQQYRQAIERTEKTLESINEELADVKTDAAKLFGDVGIDGLGEGASLAGDPYCKLGDAVAEYKKIAAAIGAVNGFRSGNVGIGISDTAKLTSELLSETAKELTAEGIEAGAKDSPLTIVGAAAVDVAVKLGEADSLLLRYTELKLAQLNLENALGRLQSAQSKADAFAFLNQIKQQLREDAVMQERWVEQQKMSRTNIVKATLENVTADVGPRGAHEIAAGAYIVDPDQDIATLRTIPNINPDFIAALGCGTANAQLLIQNMCGRYPDGSYVPVFVDPATAPPVRNLTDPTNGVVGSGWLTGKWRVEAEFIGTLPTSYLCRNMFMPTYEHVIQQWDVSSDNRITCEPDSQCGEAPSDLEKVGLGRYGRVTTDGPDRYVWKLVVSNDVFSGIKSMGQNENICYQMTVFGKRTHAEGSVPATKGSAGGTCPVDRGK